MLSEVEPVFDEQDYIDRVVDDARGAPLCAASRAGTGRQAARPVRRIAARRPQGGALIM